MIRSGKNFIEVSIRFMSSGRLQIYLLLIYFCFHLDCQFSDQRNAKLKWQDRDFAIFKIENPSWESFGNFLDTNSSKSSCKNWDSGSIKEIFKSTLVVQTSLLSNTPSSIFDRIDLYSILSDSIYQIFNESDSLPFTPLYFIVIKENDDLAPFTRILRSSLYIFCNENTLTLFFGEIRDSISFQAPYTFNDWISAPMFQIQPNVKSRISYSNLKGYNGKLLTKRFDNKEMYLDGIQWKKLEKSNQTNEKDNQNKSISKPNKADELEDRLETLNKLKQKGLISQDEYLEKRKKILDEL
jgi:hypothetical protein